MTAEPRKKARIRTLKLTVPGLFILCKALNDSGVRAAGSDILPGDAALAGEPRWDPNSQTLELDVFFHNWPTDAGDEIELLWARLLSRGDWGPGTTLDIPLAPTRR